MMEEDSVIRVKTEVDDNIAVRPEIITSVNLADQIKSEEAEAPIGTLEKQSPDAICINHKRKHDESDQPDKIEGSKTSGDSNKSPRTDTKYDSTLVKSNLLNYYECTECPFNTKRLSDFKRHYENHFAKVGEKCSYCSFRTKKSGIKPHELMHKKKKHMLKYKLHPFMTTGRKALDHQMRADHNKTPKETLTSNQPANSSDVVEIKSEASTPVIDCSNVGGSDNMNHSFETIQSDKNGAIPNENKDHNTEKSTIRDVFYDSNGNNWLRCVFAGCPYKTNTLYSLKRHRIYHKSGGPLSCKSCSFRCKNTGTLTLHLLQHVQALNTTRYSFIKKEMEGENWFGCTIDGCPYKTNNIIHLKRHQFHHERKGPFSCRSCSFSCRVRGQLQMHLRQHIKEQNHNRQDVKETECDRILKTAKSRGKKKSKAFLKYNKKSRQYYYRCPECPFIHRLKNKLLLHFKKHKADIGEKCPFCTFKGTAQEVKQHKGVHKSHKSVKKRTMAKQHKHGISIVENTQNKSNETCESVDNDQCNLNHTDQSIQNPIKDPSSDNHVEQESEDDIMAVILKQEPPDNDGSSVELQHIMEKSRMDNSDQSPSFSADKERRVDIRAIITKGECWILIDSDEETEIVNDCTNVRINRQNKLNDTEFITPQSEADSLKSFDFAKEETDNNELKSLDNPSSSVGNLENIHECFKNTSEVIMPNALKPFDVPSKLSADNTESNSVNCDNGALKSSLEKNERSSDTNDTNRDIEDSLENCHNDGLIAVVLESNGIPNEKEEHVLVYGNEKNRDLSQYSIHESPDRPNESSEVESLTMHEFVENSTSLMKTSEIADTFKPFYSGNQAKERSPFSDSITLNNIQCEENADIEIAPVVMNNCDSNNETSRCFQEDSLEHIKSVKIAETTDAANCLNICNEEEGSGTNMNEPISEKTAEIADQRADQETCRLNGDDESTKTAEDADVLNQAEISESHTEIIESENPQQKTDNKENEACILNDYQAHVQESSEICKIVQDINTDVHNENEQPNTVDENETNQNIHTDNVEESFGNESKSIDALEEGQPDKLNDNEQSNHIYNLNNSETNPTLNQVTIQDPAENCEDVGNKNEGINEDLNEICIQEIDDSPPKVNDNETCRNEIVIEDTSKMSDYELENTVIIEDVSKPLNVEQCGLLAENGQGNMNLSEVDMQGSFEYLNEGPVINTVDVISEPFNNNFNDKDKNKDLHDINEFGQNITLADIRESIDNEHHEGDVSNDFNSGLTDDHQKSHNDKEVQDLPDTITDTDKVQVPTVQESPIDLINSNVPSRNMLECMDDSCPYVTNKTLNLHRHMSFHDGKGCFECEYCTFSCKRRASLTEHLQQHDELQKEIDSNSSNDTHWTIVERPEGTSYKNMYQCQKCEYLTASPNSIKRHRRVHRNMKDPLYQETAGGEKCPLCSFKSDIEKNNLISHLLEVHRVHDNDGFMVCPLCDVKISRKETILAHIKNHKHHEIKEISTSVKEPQEITNCQKNNKTLEVDFQMTFQCMYCPAKMSTENIFKWHLKQHFRTEGGVPCPLCTYRSHKTDLFQHVSCHVTNKNGKFQCPICDTEKCSDEFIKDHLKVAHSRAIFQKHNPLCNKSYCRGYC